MKNRRPRWRVLVALASTGLLSGCYYYPYGYYPWGASPTQPYASGYPYYPPAPVQPAVPPNQPYPPEGAAPPPDAPIQRSPLPPASP